MARVTALLGRWAAEMALDAETSAAWRDAGRWHDALRDAPEAEMRAILDDSATVAPLLHGPAAAVCLERDGERRTDVLEAIRHHTIGSAEWDATGRALYMADYLEPGRPFDSDARAALAARVPGDFDAVFREVVQRRVDWTRRDGHEIHAQTAALWEAVR